MAGGCYLQRARESAAKAGVVVTNHALLLQDARMKGALLPASDHLIVDEAHRLEEVATDAFGVALEDRLVRRALERVSRAPAVTGSTVAPSSSIRSTFGFWRRMSSVPMYTMHSRSSNAQLVALATPS